MNDWEADLIMYTVIFATAVLAGVMITGWVFHQEPTEVIGTAIYKLIN
jgi:hypothetical protein